ncbi:MAG: flagellar FlbD family protein [Ignavibacteria bacterium]|nr:flagellar FlbD family protein [Ignavibacteria bacterium]
MVTLTKIDGSQIVINADEIETVESNYNSTITFCSGKKIVVTETPDEIVAKVINYRKECFSQLLNPQIEK